MFVSMEISCQSILTVHMGSRDSLHNNNTLIQFSRFYSGIHGYVAVAICIWGTVANLANVAVLTRRKMASPTNLILTWLAVADVLTMLTCLPTNVHFYIQRDDQLPQLATRSVAWIRYFLFHANSTVACHTIAIWLTITLAIFRYVYINFPFAGASFCNVRSAKIAIASVYASTLLLCIPNCLSVDIQEHCLNQTSVLLLDNSSLTDANRCDVVCEATFYSVRDRTGVLYEINHWIHAVFFKLLPCALLTILTCLLIKVMHDSHSRRLKLERLGQHEESTATGEHNRTTAMLFTVVCLFLVTELPQGVLTLCSIFIDGFYEDVYLPLGDLLDFLALLNNSINFVLYCTMSNKFRRTFVELFCDGSRCCRPDDDGGRL